MTSNFTMAEKIWLENHADYNERWVQTLIAEHPKILGLGDDLIVKDKERIQPRAGRLDLLLQDDSNTRYEVEIQLGAADESHIVRTIEYWDIERKRYPRYDHCAVLVAEDVTSRFLNVISLFNGSIPIIALQMNAVKVGDHITLFFTKVLDTTALESPDDDGVGPTEVTDRTYWETVAASKETVALADQLVDLARSFAPSLQPNYTKFYMGLNCGDRLFGLLRPRKTNHVKAEIRLPQSSETEQELERAGIDIMGYDKNWKAYMLRLTKSDIEKNSQVLRQLLGQAYETVARR